MEERRKFFIEISYDGTEFSGWQVQPDAPSVQEVLQKKLSRLFGDVPISVYGSSRTDAGVHALGMAVMFSAPPSPYIPDWKIKKAMNKLLPPSIRINHLRQVDESFHARYDAKAKAYTYVICTEENPSPFISRWSWHLPSFKETGAFKEALSHLIGTHDFSSFTVERNKIDDAVRTIFSIDVKEFDNCVCTTFIGSGFLYKMIRSVMGTAALAGTGRLKVDEIVRILEAKNRVEAGETAPPQGLFLVKVFYEEGAWEGFKTEQPPFYL